MPIPRVEALATGRARSGSSSAGVARLLAARAEQMRSGGIGMIGHSGVVESPSQRTVRRGRVSMALLRVFLRSPQRLAMGGPCSGPSLNPIPNVRVPGQRALQELASFLRLQYDCRSYDPQDRHPGVAQHRFRPADQVPPTSRILDRRIGLATTEKGVESLMAIAEFGEIVFNAASAPSPARHQKALRGTGRPLEQSGGRLEVVWA